jgi:hypothetical protein
MSEKTRELLAQLIEATALPPVDEAPPEEVLEAARAMVERRTVLVEALAALGPVEEASEIEAEWTALRQREDWWADRILAARNDLARRLDAMRRLPHHRSPVRKSIGARRRA